MVWVPKAEGSLASVICRRKRTQLLLGSGSEQIKICTCNYRAQFKLDSRQLGIGVHLNKPVEGLMQLWWSRALLLSGLVRQST